ncbi:hypothetical protein GCM10007242_16680 [Pigmentiphaga litoralis]|uniref:hypothetical protein n=1 Tax=Pigmentiphaga litoralis TaxID=516702 RepID=UPI0019CED192|nr:hypothetical protein [Pigmentiphaga litoralis]GGX11258.1 hypothetical protein GCM10007242_16680 [Pigmentiphaga litoralis]
MTNGLRWTEEQLAARQANQAVARVLRADAAMKKFQALGRLPKNKMNKTEEAYSRHLDQQKQRGEVIDWKFHPMRIRLADNTFYEVDFLVLHADLRVAIHETKGGFTTDKGQMKIKVCAETLPWFSMIKATKLPAKLGGGWKLEEF